MRSRTPLALLTAGAVALSTLALSAGAALADDQAGANAPSVGAVTVPFDANTPSDLTIVDSGNRTVWLDWNAPLDDDGTSRDGLTAYRIKTVVYANPEGLPTPSLGSASVDFANSAGKVAGLTNGVTYAFAVAAVVNGKTSAYSSPAVVAAPDPAGIPADFRITDSGYGRVNLDWLAVDEASGYRIKTTVVDANGVVNPSAGAASIDVGNSLGYVSGLTTGVTYGFTVSAIVDGQDGPASAQLTHTMRAVPGTPGTPVATAVAASSISVKWTPAAIASGVGSITGYTVEVTPTVVGAAYTVDAGVGASVTLPNLVKGASYRIRVAAVNNAGKGLYSPARTYTATNKTNQVRSLTAERSQDGTTIYLDWLAPSNNGGQAPTSYSVTQTPTGGVKTIDVRNTSARVTGLDPQTTYRYTVKAVNDAGAAATGVSIGVLADAPEILEPPVAHDDLSVTMKFTPMDDDSLDYQVQALQVAPANLLATTTTVEADSIDCQDGTCSATWDRFGSSLNGNPWLFRVRATNGVDTYSGWRAITPEAPGDALTLTSAQAIDGQWHIVWVGDWTKRLNQGVATMSVNGANAEGGNSGALGVSPGRVTVKLVGLGGSSEQMYDLSGQPDGPYVEAEGGTVSEYTDAYTGVRWRSHTFTGPGTFVVRRLPADKNFDVLIVGAGGGGGGNSGSGGGGAGGYWEDYDTQLALGEHAVSVGMSNGAGSGISGYVLPDGRDLVPGGGQGGRRQNGYAGGSGASGGGGGSEAHATDPGSGIAPYGHGGGPSYYSQSLANGGGGGGAGGGGQAQFNEFGGGAGGPGRANVFRDGTSQMYAWGGSASGRDTGGSGDGPANTGAGAGGNSGAGGTGIVVIRYQIAAG